MPNKPTLPKAVERAIEKEARSIYWPVYEDGDDINSTRRLELANKMKKGAEIALRQQAQEPDKYAGYHQRVMDAMHESSIDGRCRDCADNVLSGRCPDTGELCDPSEAALELLRNRNNSAPQQSGYPVEIVSDLAESLDILMKWCVANIQKWNFPQYDIASRALTNFNAHKSTINGK